MATNGIRNIERLHLLKIRRRADEIGRRVYADPRPVKDVALAETKRHLEFPDAKQLQYQPVRPGRRWGKPWGTGWFRLRLRIPAAFKGHPVSLLFRPGGEGLIFRDGVPVQALDHGRSDYPLVRKAKGGERIELYVESGANGPFGKFEEWRMEEPRVAVFLPEVWAAYVDLDTFEGMVKQEGDPFLQAHRAKALPEDDTRRSRIVYVLNRAVDAFDYHDTTIEALTRSARHVRRALKELKDCHAVDSAQTVACMGHAHIDVAWLWPLAETKRKCGRTFSNVLGLMERYPEFLFCQSQPQLYEWTKTRYPALYKRIHEQVKAGQWIPTGAAWVEPDCNVTSGESLVRQLMYGSRFFRDEFGVEPVCLWLPDVFGYPAALPQILRKSGLKYFLTTKISWNQFTTFPYHTFHWEGIDGSRVLTHFPPANTYNGEISAPRQLTAAARYAQKDRAPLHAALYGYGDGGGGPTAEMIERMKRFKDLEGMPHHVPMGPKPFFERLERESTDLPVWQGELYLELHRGTFTTQARNKRFNRRCELLLRDVEMLSALNSISGEPYPRETLVALWKRVLTNQFHDILPGSSIGKVYEDSDRDYDQIVAELEKRRTVALDSLGESTQNPPRSRPGGGTTPPGGGSGLLAVNTLGWDREGVVSVPARGLSGRSDWVAVGVDGKRMAAQIGSDGCARFRASLPSLGYALFRLEHADAGDTNGGELLKARAGGRGCLLENGRVLVRFDARGTISSFYDKVEDREVIEEGCRANQFLLFEDKPTNWDAWDIDVFYNDKVLETDGELISAEVLECGTVRGVLRFERKISQSTIRQDVILYTESPRLDFETTVEWGDEKDVLLKVAFPVSVRSPRARFDIQFGSIERPTHANMPQDYAQFEVPGQKWADLSEEDYGVALLNDCKYGYDVRDNVIRLSLLRAPKYPDTEADVNRTHTFTYAVLPHPGSFANGVVRAGYELNCPVQCAPVRDGEGGKKDASAASRSYLGVSGDNIVIDGVKLAEDDDGIIVRLYESHGCRGKRRLDVGLPVQRAVRVDLMEREEDELPIRDGGIDLDFSPFEIVSVKLVG